MAKIARKKGHKVLAKLSKIIEGDEMRHHLAYTAFVKEIFTIDPSEMMLAYWHMMKHKIVMPAYHLRESFSQKRGYLMTFQRLLNELVYIRVLNM